jgi:hypothetical protein
MITIVFLIIVILIPAVGFGAEPVRNYLIPKTVQLQYAGDMGLVSIGAGYTFMQDKGAVNFIYGYLPEWVNGVEVNTIAVKGTFQLLPITINSKLTTSTYVGTAVLRCFAHNTYVNFPSYFPHKYYFTNALHVSIILGQNFKFKRLKNFSVFTEISTLDYYMYYYLKNKHLDFQDIWNISFGISAKIR